MTTRTHRTSRAFLAGAGLGALIAFPAIAGLPEVLDHVPADATAVVVIDNLNTLDQHFTQFVGAIEMPAMVTPKQMLGQLGIGQNLNMDGSAALVVLSVDIDAGDGEFVFLAPTKDYNSLVGAFNAVDTGAGIKSFTVEDDTVFAKQVGAWAALSTDRGVLEEFSGKGGSLGAFRANLGASGTEMAETSDLFVTVNPAMMTPMLEKMHEELGANAGKIPGANAEQMEAQMAMARQLVEGFIRDGSSAGFGLRFGAMGVSATGSMAFKPGTEGAGFFNPGGDSGSLLSKLPQGPFLFAFAMDHSAPMAVATMAWLERSGLMNMQQGMGMGAFNMDDLHENMTGSAGAVYPNSAGFMGGIFANMITYSSSKNPGKLRAAIQEKFGAIQMDDPQVGLSITSSYTPNESQIAGKSADGYAINLNMDAMAGGMGFSPMQMIFGSPNGPAGYIVEANGGVYQSYSRGSTMLTPAVEGRSSLGEDKAITQVAQNLPKGRYAEFYLGVRPILDQVVPFLGMMGMGQMDLPEQMPPVGFGVASREGGAVFGSFVPAQTIKSAVQIAMTMQGAMGGGAGGWGDEQEDGPGF
jgi:hypothetical protein